MLDPMEEPLSLKHGVISIHPSREKVQGLEGKEMRSSTAYLIAPASSRRLLERVRDF